MKYRSFKFHKQVSIKLTYSVMILSRSLATITLPSGTYHEALCLYLAYSQRALTFLELKKALEI